MPIDRARVRRLKNWLQENDLTSGKVVKALEPSLVPGTKPFSAARQRIYQGIRTGNLLLIKRLGKRFPRIVEDMGVNDAPFLETGVRPVSNKAKAQHAQIQKKIPGGSGLMPGTGLSGEALQREARDRTQKIAVAMWQASARQQGYADAIDALLKIELVPVKLSLAERAALLRLLKEHLGTKSSSTGVRRAILELVVRRLTPGDPSDEGQLYQADLVLTEASEHPDDWKALYGRDPTMDPSTIPVDESRADQGP